MLNCFGHDLGFSVGYIRTFDYYSASHRCCSSCCKSPVRFRFSVARTKSRQSSDTLDSSILTCQLFIKLKKSATYRSNSILDDTLS